MVFKVKGLESLFGQGNQLSLEMSPLRPVWKFPLLYIEKGHIICWNTHTKKAGTLARRGGNGHLLRWHLHLLIQQTFTGPDRLDIQMGNSQTTCGNWTLTTASAVTSQKPNHNRPATGSGSKARGFAATSTRQPWVSQWFLLSLFLPPPPPFQLRINQTKPNMLPKPIISHEHI